MISDPKLEATIDQILNRTETEIMGSLNQSFSESQKTMDDSLNSLEQEHDRIIGDGKKEAEKIEKQIIGSSDLDARNKQILLVEEFVEKVFSKALEKIRSTDRNDNYLELVSKLLTESTEALGTSEVIVYTNSKDQDMVKNLLSKFSGAELSSETLECLGGVIVKSKDEAMQFDNTLDARVERMKPLIRKEIANKFGLGI